MVVCLKVECTAISAESDEDTGEDVLTVGATVHLDAHEPGPVTTMGAWLLCSLLQCCEFCEYGQMGALQPTTVWQM